MFVGIQKLLTMIVVAGMCIFFISPIVALFSQFRVDQFFEFLSSHSFIKSFNNTVVTGATSAFISMLFGVLFAKLFAYFQWQLKRWQRLGILVPYLIPNFILASAYTTAWDPNVGILNRWFPLPFSIYGVSGLIFAFTITHFPVAFLLIEEKFKKLDHNLIEAAKISGARFWQVLFKIELPLLLPTLLSSFALCFSLSVSAFAIPAWLGAPEHVYPLTYKIYQAVQGGGAEGLSEAASYGLVLLALSCLPLIATFIKTSNEKKYVTIAGKYSSTPSFLLKGTWLWAWNFSFAVLQCAFWFLPLFILFLTTFLSPGCLQQHGFNCFSSASSEAYRYALFELELTTTAAKTSLLYGVISAGCIGAFSILALFISNNSSLLRQVFSGVFTLPLATPGAIIALSLIVIYSGKFGINLYNTPWIAVVAYVVKHQSIAYEPLRTGFANISGTLIEAAQISGASTTTVWRRIIAPLLRPEFMGAYFLILIPIIGELTMSVFLSSPKFQPIGNVLFQLQDYADQRSAAVLSILLVVMVMTINQAVHMFSKGKLGY